MRAFRVSRSGGGGMSYSQLRTSRFAAPTRGVRVQGELTWYGVVQSVALVLRDGAAFSHLTAAQLWGFALPVMDGIPLDVTAPVRGSRRQVRWHAGDLEGSIVERAGLPVTSPARTWQGLGACLDLPWQVAVTDQGLRRGLLTLDQLTVPVRCRGAVTLRRAREIADPRSRSVRESVLRVHLLLAGLPAPELNWDIVEDGGWIACGDFVWPEYRLVVEYDGEHHAAARQRHQDAQTRNELADRGWRVRVLTSRHLDRVEHCVEMIAQLLRHAGWRG